ncbi:hypothetical protein FB639_000877, partial [Coemansia asiatica]
DQLGYDPTVFFNDAKNRWEIKVFDDNNDNDNRDNGNGNRSDDYADIHSFKTYQILTCMRVAERVFGRHTRCFRCREITDSDNDDNNNNNASSDKDVLTKKWGKFTLEELCETGNILVKDAWAHAERDAVGDSSRDEITLMREINDALGDISELADKFPAVLAAGIVRQSGSDGQMHLDTVDDILALVKDSLPRDQVHQRVHKRIAMTPIGKNLREVKCVDELIIAAADAMEVHTAISKKCRILHRDISSNNILIRQSLDTGRVHGILIDFDCALRIDHNSDKDRPRRPDMTGTRPYMSIGNLSQSSVERTVLDDWESIIYVLCWLGTFGVNYDDEHLHNNEDIDENRPKIYNWNTGTSASIADDKRTDMHSQAIFRSRIVNRFIKKSEYIYLKRLVVALREKLIDNPNVSGLGRGSLNMIDDNDDIFEPVAVVEEDYWDSKCSKDERDPFVRRSICADLIADDLLKVMIQARKEAISRLYEYDK